MKLKVENKTVVSNLTVDEINRVRCLLIENKQKDFLSSNEIKRELANN